MSERRTMAHVGAALDALTAHRVAVEEVHRRAAEEAHSESAGGHVTPYRARHEQQEAPDGNG